MSKLEEYEIQIANLEQKILRTDHNSKEMDELRKQLDTLKEEAYANLTNWDRVCIARSDKRIRAKNLIEKFCPTFFEMHGDQYFAEDASIIAGIGFLDEMPITILAQAKGVNTQENITRNFGMASPEGFRKALRVAKESEKFNRPILTIVDTSGAYPGKGAEERGQARAIANNLLEFSKLRVPVIAIVLSEGGSGGALALTISDYIYMFENAIYSILSPEGFASILFKNTIKPDKVCDVMKLTSYDLYNYHIVDEIIKEPLGGLHYLEEEFILKLKENIKNKIKELSNLDVEERLNRRYEKYRNIGKPSKKQE